MSTYEPGIVAVATVCGVPDMRVFRHVVDGKAYWHTTGWTSHEDSDVTDVRPLVTLNLSAAESTPESILRFAAKVINDGRSGYEKEASHLRDWADQIEAQTKPPKPAEPTGLGAVVEDAEGYRWVRHTDHEGANWYRDNVRHGWRMFADIDAVKVLSPGVSDAS